MSSLGVRNSCMLTPSAFMASAAATLSLQEAILPDPVCGKDYLAVSLAMSIWKTITPEGQPSDSTRHIQRAWETSVVKTVYNNLLSICDTPADMPRLTAVASPHAGDWLHAPPITATGLHGLSCRKTCTQAHPACLAE